MEFRIVKEYERKNRKRNNKLISLPTDTELKGNDKVVVMTEAEYKEIKEVNQNDKKTKSYIDELNKEKERITILLNDNEKLEKEIEQLKEKLNQVLTDDKTKNNQLDLLAETKNNLIQQLQEQKTKLEILEGQTIEYNTLSLKYNYLIEEQEEREQELENLKDRNNKQTQEIETLKDDKLRLNQTVTYYKHIKELLENRGFISRLLNRPIKTEFKNPESTDNKNNK